MSDERKSWYMNNIVTGDEVWLFLKTKFGSLKMRIHIQLLETHEQ